ncbi:MAG: RsmD family RNA methyltransferase, partial [Clostridia bacterium]
MALTRLSSQGVKFDIIFVDPPYLSNIGLKAIEFIMSAGLLEKQGIIIYEHNSLNLLQDMGKSYIIEFERSYGQTTIDIIRRV